MKNDDVVVVLDKPLLTYIQIPLELNKKLYEYLSLKYCKNEDEIRKNESEEIANVIAIGLIHAKNSFSKKESTLLHKGKKPRADVWERLGSVAAEFLKCYTYPKIPGGNLIELLNKALGGIDHRVFKDYKKTVLNYCNISEDIIKRCTNYPALGELDVSLFVKQIPKQYISTSSTSSFSE